MSIEETYNYKDWFWANLDAEGLRIDFDTLVNQDNFSLKEKNSQPEPPYNDANILQFNDYIEQIQQAAELARIAEQKKHLEMIRVAANMYALQGDTHGAEICQTIENLLKTA